MWKQVGVHLGTRSTEGVASVVEVLDELYMCPFLRALSKSFKMMISELGYMHRYYDNYCSLFLNGIIHNR